MNYHYCYSIKRSLLDKEIEYAKELGTYIFYDEAKDTFYDKDNLEIDIKDISIFPRTGVLEAKRLIDAIIRHHGNCLIKKEDYDKTLNWPYYIKTKRKVILLSGRQIIDNPQLIVDIFGNEKVFFKTKHKNFSRVINISNFFKSNIAFYQALEEHEDEDFIISESVEIQNDEHGLLEYRAFIVDNEILNISRISERLLGSIPKEVIEKLKEVVTELKETDFPNSYVIDLFVYKDKNENNIIDVLECNTIISSGTYLYNSIFQKINDLEHKCPSASIPKDKTKYGSRYKNNYSYKANDKANHLNYYNLSGSFAADLISFSLYGKKSSSDTYNYLTSDTVLKKVKTR